MTDFQELVTVYRAGQTTEAHFVKNLLLDEEIEAFVSEENEPLAGLSIATPDVLVKKGDADRASVIIREYEQQLIDRAERPNWTCPSCKATVIGARDTCDSCGADRPGSEDESEL